jgi:hypothetical protein
VTFKFGPAAGAVATPQGSLLVFGNSNASAGPDLFGNLEVGAQLIAAKSLTWDATQGGVDYAYTISGADLPQPTTAALYWAPTATFDPTLDAVIPDSVFTTATAAQSEPYMGNIDAESIDAPPAGDTYLLFVVDPDNLISPAGPGKVAPLALLDISMQNASEASPTDITASYTVDNADLTQPLEFDVYQSTVAPAAGATFVPGPNDIFVGSASLPASDTIDLSMGSHTGVKLTPNNPLKSDPTHTYVVVVANPPGSNHIPESDDPSDANNTVYFQLPDVRLDDVTTFSSSASDDPPNFTIFKDYQVDYSVSNSASPPFMLRAYLAPGPNFDLTQDTRLGETTVGTGANQDQPIPPNDRSSPYTATLHLPTIDVTQSTNHYIIMVADPDRLIAESSRTSSALFAVPIIENGYRINREGQVGTGKGSVVESSPNASGPYMGAILSVDGVDELANLNTIWSPSPLFQFQSSYTGLTPGQIALKEKEERLGQPSLLLPLANLVELIQEDEARDPQLWGTVFFQINAAYDSTGSHRGPKSHSLHYEGRALDIQIFNAGATTPRPDLLGRLAGLAWLAGFDWSWVESSSPSIPASHLHVSVRSVIQPNILAPIGDQTATKGTTLSLQATVPDPGLSGDHFTYSLGAGAPPGAVIDPTTGMFSWTPGIGPGVFPVTIHVDDTSIPGSSGTRTFSVTVVAPSITFDRRSDADLPAGTTFIQSGSISVPGLQSWTASVDYGDGSGFQPLALTPSGTFTLQHSYTSPGTFEVAVKAMNPSGAAVIQTLSVRVAAPLPSGFGAGRDAFVTTLYVEDLGRLPESSGLRSWSKLLASGAKPLSVALAIWTSPERLKLVNQCLAHRITFGKSYADALLAWKEADRSQVAAPAGPLALLTKKHKTSVSG